MPTYEYECTECVVSTEVYARINDTYPYPICPKCNEVMERKWTAAPAIFKAKGFYSTDNK